MASSSSSLCSPLPLPFSSANSHSLGHRTSTAFTFPFAFHSKRRFCLPLKNAPPPLKVFCTRDSRGLNRGEKTAKSDPIYRNRLVNMFVNRILKNGKKSLAYYIIYRALKRIQQKTKSNPLSVLRQAIREVTPDVAVKVRRVGGSIHQVPVELGSGQGRALAIRWLLNAAHQRQGPDMAFKLSCELMEAAKGRGNAVRQKEMILKMAEANRAFAHISAAVTKDSWEKLILKSDVPVLVEFFASWCGPCRMVHRVIDEIAAEYDGMLKCYVLNTDTDLQIAENYEIKAVPVVLLFKNGQKQEMVVGTMPKEFYVSAIERVLHL